MGSREVVVVFVHVYQREETDVLEVADAGDAPRLLARLGERGQQHGGKNCDDRDDDQEFNQGEGLFHG